MISPFIEEASPLLETNKWQQKSIMARNLMQTKNINCGIQEFGMVLDYELLGGSRNTSCIANAYLYSNR